MSEAAAVPRPQLMRTAGRAGVLFLLAYVVLSAASGQRVVLLGDLAQLVPPLAFVILTWRLAEKSRGQARAFWRLNAVHGVLWSAGQVVWTYYDVFRGGVPVISPTDPIFFASSLPIAAALYGRPDRERPRGVFEIVLLDIVLIALFSAFAYTYFVVAVTVSQGTESVYNTTLTQLLNARNLVLALWALRVWWTATDPAWRRVLALYSAGLWLSLVGGIGYDVIEFVGGYYPGSIWDAMWMAPYLVLILAAAAAWDAGVFAPSDVAPPMTRLPVVSLFAIALLVLIPATDEIARRLLGAPPDLQALRTRIALTTMIPFGVVVVLREFLSRRTLLRAGQELLAARERLAEHEKLAAMGRLVSGVAHELNNPLQGVLGHTELLLEDAAPGDERRELEAIGLNARRAASIVRNLLTFAGRPTSARAWHYLDDIVRRVIDERAASLAGKGIDVRLDAAGNLPPLFVDGTRLEEVFLNLLRNAEAAIEARAAGRSSTPGTIVVTTRRADTGDWVEVRVADNGIGIRDEDLVRVFDPFFTTHGNESIGLGLSVCFGSIQEYGGEIRAGHNDGGGAVFTVELPCNANGERASQAHPARQVGGWRGYPQPDTEAKASTRPSGLRPRAIVVDDQESNAAIVRRALERAGYDVASSTVSRRAVTMIEQTPYDVVIADVKMPEIDGPELYARVCQIRPEMARRFIFITGDNDGEDTRQFLADTRCGHFLKPFNLERLVAAADALVGREAGGDRASLPG